MTFSVGNQTKQNIFKTFSQNVKDPFIVVDASGNIVSYNEEAANLLSLKFEDQNIYDIFEKVTSEQFNKFIDELLQSIVTPHFRDLEISLNNGNHFQSQVTLNKIGEEDELYIFCTFRLEPKKVKYERVSNLRIESNDPSELIQNKSILNILNKIGSYFPLTFIGKEKLRKEIDSLEENFWIKGADGTFLLVNERFSKSFGLKPIHVEGKDEQTFIPDFMKNIFKAIENHIVETFSCVVLSGIPFKDFSTGEEFKTFLFPLIYGENKVAAIIGISQKGGKSDVTFTHETWINPGIKMIENLPLAFAFADNEGKIKHASKEFCKLFSEEYENLNGIGFVQVFPIELADTLKKFINSSFEIDKFDLGSLKNIYTEFEPGSNLIFTKIYDDQNSSVGIALSVETVNPGDDLERIITRRGRMFEVLIQNNPEPIFIYDKENLKFLEANDAALNLYGYRKDEFLQMDLTDLYSSEDIQSLLDSPEREVIKEGKFQGPYRHKKKDGSSVYVLISKTPFKYADKNSEFNIIRDITEELNTNKQTQLFKAAFDNTGDLLFITDSSGFINFVNTYVSIKLGHTRDDLDRTAFAALVRDADRGVVNTSIFQSHLKETVSLNMDLKNSTGEFIPAEIIATPVLEFDKEVDSFLIIGKLKNSSQETGPIEIIKEIVVEKPVTVFKEKKSSSDLNFLSNVFHEILTPINVILGFVQDLTENLSELTPEQKEASEIISQNRTDLLNIMNSFAEFSQIEENAIELRTGKVGITEIIDVLQTEIKNNCHLRDVEFGFGKISSSLQFETDSQKFIRLGSLLFDLISRLSKANKLYFSANQFDDERFIISFKDNYSNVSPELCESLSLCFVEKEADASQRFGLSISTLRLTKSLLNLLHGKFQKIEKDFSNLPVRQAGPDYGFVFPLEFHAVEEETLPAEEEVVNKVETFVDLEPEVDNEAAEENVTVKEDVVPSESDTFKEEQLSSETEAPPREEVTDENKVEEEEQPEIEQETIEEPDISQTGDLGNLEWMDDSEAESEIPPEAETYEEQEIKETEPTEPVIEGKTDINFNDAEEFVEKDQIQDEQIIAPEETNETGEVEIAEEAEQWDDSIKEESIEEKLPEEEEKFIEEPAEKLNEEETEAAENVNEVAEEPEVKQEITETSDENVLPEEESESVEQKEQVPEIVGEKVGEKIFEQQEAEEETEIPEEIETKAKVDLSTLSCLYLEDQVDSQILFKVQLKGLKGIKFAVSFEESVPLLESHHFDFIVVDINLQGEYNGLDALRMIHQMPKYEDTPIIAVTAYVLPGDKEKFIAAGFHDFISKPIFKEKMIDSLNKIFVNQ
jgi:PAS domain S-box-containing protein